MKRLIHTALIVLALTLAMPAHADDPVFTPEELKDHLWEFDDLGKVASRLPPKKLITRTYKRDDSKVNGGLSIGLIKAPLDKIMPVARDYANFKDMLPFFKESTVLGSGGGRTLLHVKIELVKGVVTLWANLEFIESEGKNGVKIIDGSMLKGNMKVFHARFELAPLGDDQTLILVRLFVDPDINIAKDSKVNKYNQVNARRFIRAVRDRTAPLPD